MQGGYYFNIHILSPKLFVKHSHILALRKKKRKIRRKESHSQVPIKKLYLSPVKLYRESNPVLLRAWDGNLLQINFPERIEIVYSFTDRNVSFLAENTVHVRTQKCK